MRLSLIGGILLVGFLHSQTASNAIQGTVTDQTGAPLPGAILTYHQAISYLPRMPGQSGWNPVLAPGQVTASGSVTASTTGAFQTPNLPSGTYGVCAYHPSEPYLDPCLWGLPIAITPPGTAGSGKIVLAKGVYLNVNVDDPAGLLTQASLMRSDLTVGVMFGGGGFRAASATQSQTGRNYQILIPANQPLQCWIWSGDYTLADGSGNPIPASGKAFPFDATIGVDQVFNFKITGKRTPQPTMN